MTIRRQADDQRLPDPGDPERMSVAEQDSVMRDKEQDWNRDEPIRSKGTADLLNANKADASSVSLLNRDKAGDFQARWMTIQTKFVDEPRQAVEEADSLVADVVTLVTQLFADKRHQLEQQWSRGDNVSTEDLRLALQQYRSFFDRLLTQ